MYENGIKGTCGSSGIFPSKSMHTNKKENRKLDVSVYGVVWMRMRLQERERGPSQTTRMQESGDEKENECTREK